MQTYTLKSSKAFVSTFNLQPSQAGLLNGLTFAVKDNIDVAHYKTSYGSKPWYDTHPPAVNHAVCVEQILNAGATCLGKTISDEFTYSLDGENYFYGTPINPKAPDRIPGGSSSGSASAVACGLVDFALGTDCAGSIRVPASHCGLLGMRFTTHRISEAGVLPFAPSSSTIGILTNKLSILQKISTVLLGVDSATQVHIDNIYLLEDAFALADPEINLALQESIAQLKALKKINVSFIKFSDIVEEKSDLFSCNESAFKIIQDAEIWNSIGSWIETFHPKMGPRVAAGLDNVKHSARSSINNARQLSEKIFSKVVQFTKPGDLFCFPTVPMIPPLLGALDNPSKYMDYNKRAMAITSFAGVAQLPELSIPISTVKDIPVGLSLVAGHRDDQFLIAAAKELFRQFI